MDTEFRHCSNYLKEKITRKRTSNFFIKDQQTDGNVKKKGGTFDRTYFNRYNVRLQLKKSFPTVGTWFVQIKIKCAVFFFIKVLPLAIAHGL